MTIEKAIEILGELIRNKKKRISTPMKKLDLHWKLPFVICNLQENLIRYKKNLS